jgi:U2 small nuclear ribonucleoprotein A'
MDHRRAQDQDAIDFTDNDITSLSNFPFFPRLRTLMLARNRVNHIQPTLASSIPNLTSLVLTSNNLAELADLDPLRNFAYLTHVVLMENPVTRKEVCDCLLVCCLVLSRVRTNWKRDQNYRYWVIWRNPNIRFLDYQKVKDVERAKAKELFGTQEEPSALASKIVGIKSRTFDVPSIGTAADGTAGRAAPGERAIRVKLTEKERKRVEKMIREAKSLQEIAQLEKELNEGRIPGGMLDALGDGDDEDRMQM